MRTGWPLSTLSFTDPSRCTDYLSELKRESNPVTMTVHPILMTVRPQRDLLPHHSSGPLRSVAQREDCVRSVASRKRFLGPFACRGADRIAAIALRRG